MFVTFSRQMELKKLMMAFCLLFLMGCASSYEEPPGTLYGKSLKCIDDRDGRVSDPNFFYFHKMKVVEKFSIYNGQINTNKLSKYSFLGVDTIYIENCWSINRQTLKARKCHLQSETHSCKLLNSRQDIIDELERTLRESIKDNKI